MTEFIYNNVKNASISHILFKLNCGYHPCILFEDNANSRSKSCLAEELAKELRDLMFIYQQYLFYIQEV